MGLNELNEYIPNLLIALGQFLSTGIMFYIMSILIFSMIVNIFINFIRRR